MLDFHDAIFLVKFESRLGNSVCRSHQWAVLAVIRNFSDKSGLVAVFETQLIFFVAVDDTIAAVIRERKLAQIALVIVSEKHLCITAICIALFAVLIVHVSDGRIFFVLVDFVSDWVCVIKTGRCSHARTSEIVTNSVFKIFNRDGGELKFVVHGVAPINAYRNAALHRRDFVYLMLLVDFDLVDDAGTFAKFLAHFVADKEDAVWLHT